MFHAVADGFWYLFGFLGQLFGKLMDGLYRLLQPLFDLLGLVWEFVYYIGLVVVKVVHLVFTVARLLLGLGLGLTKTIFGFGYTGSSAAIPSKYATAFAHIQPVIHTMQLDKLAYIFTFAIWLFTAYTAIKIIGDMRS